MRLYNYGWIGRKLSSAEVKQLVTYYARIHSCDGVIPDGHLIEPAKEADIELMVTPSQRVLKMTRKKYLDDFFERGIVQLGTYDFFRSADSPEVRDHQEGHVILVGEGIDRTAWGTFQGGGDNYVFCTYLGDPDPAVLKSFGYDAFYCIDNPEGLASAIRTALDAHSFSFGKCVYCQEKALIGELRSDHSFERLDHRTIEMVGEAMHFVKPVKYSRQSEFRFTWKVSAELRGTLIVECPDAVQFCSLP